MTFENAHRLFDAMDEDEQARVVRTFDLIRLSFKCDHQNGICGIRDAFAEAVEDESHAIEIQMLLEHETAGAA